MSDDLRQHKDLRDAGYAPGNYTFKCMDCGCEAVGDKRARRCLSCAEKRTLSGVSSVSSNPVLAKWGKHRLACPPECMECEMRAEIERLTRGMNGQADVMVARERELAAALKRIDELERANVGLATESERRRAALQVISVQTNSSAEVCSLATTARRALSDELGLAGEFTDSDNELGALVRRIEIICDSTGRDPLEYLAGHSPDETPDAPSVATQVTVAPQVALQPYTNPQPMEGAFVVTIGGPAPLYTANTPICHKCGQIDIRIPRMGIYHVCPPEKASDEPG